MVSGEKGECVCAIRMECGDGGAGDPDMSLMVGIARDEFEEVQRGVSEEGSVTGDSAACDEGASAK